MTTPNFTEGKLKITTTCGEVEVDAHFFEWNGIRLAVSQNRFPRAGQDYGTYCLTHPETGMAFPNICKHSVELVYQSFIDSVPELERMIHNRHGKSLKEMLENKAKNRGAEIEAARRKHEAKS